MSHHAQGASHNTRSVTHYIVQIPPRNPELGEWRMYEVPYRTRHSAIAACEAHRSYGFYDADYIEVQGEYDECTL
jgi:hypothetical protein